MKRMSKTAFNRWLAPAPNAPLAGVLKEDIQRNLDFEIENQNEDGSWSPTWLWAEADPESWTVAETEWKGILTLATLGSLRDFGRIEGYPPWGQDPLSKYALD